MIGDLENVLLEADSGGGAVARYTLNPQPYGELVSQRRGGESLFHHYDALGSTRAVTNSAQAVTDTADYQAFGLPNAATGSTPNPFRWVGQLGYYWQPDSGDYWVRARVYGGQVGRWLSRDPGGLDRLPYAYVGNRPLWNTDATGLGGQVVYPCPNEEECGCRAETPRTPWLPRLWGWRHKSTKPVRAECRCRARGECHVEFEHLFERYDCRNGALVTETRTESASVRGRCVQYGPGPCDPPPAFDCWACNTLLHQKCVDALERGALLPCRDIATAGWTICTTPDGEHTDTALHRLLLLALWGRYGIFP